MSFERPLVANIAFANAPLLLVLDETQKARPQARVLARHHDVAPSEPSVRPAAEWFR